MGIKTINHMIKRILIAIIISIFFLHPVDSARALEGLVKFVGKNNAAVFLELAVTDEQKAKGLMGRPSLAENRGMVFIFRPAKKVTFFMKDTLIPLDMIFINRGKIIKIVKNAIPNRDDILYPSDGAVTEVVEVNGGYSDERNIKVGDSVIFENIAQIDYSKNSKLMIVAK